MKNKSGQQRHLSVTNEGMKKKCEVLLWLTVNETICNKEFPLFFKEKEALRDFFRFAIIHAYV
jgi:hypothetical protein